VAEGGGVKGARWFPVLAQRARRNDRILVKAGGARWTRAMGNQSVALPENADEQAWMDHV
jgi:hypothetical protein